MAASPRGSAESLVPRQVLRFPGDGLSCSCPPHHTGVTGLRALGKLLESPQEQEQNCFSKPPMGMAPGDEEAGSREPGGSLRIGGWDHMGGGNGPPARFALSSPVFKSE